MTYEYDNPKFNIIVHGLYKGALVSSLVTTYDEKPFPWTLRFLIFFFYFI